MMKKIIILVTASTMLMSSDYIDKKPSVITKHDLEIIKNFDKIAYKIADEKNEKIYNIKKIVNFIFKNRKHIEDYMRLKIDIETTAGYRTARGGEDAYNTVVNTKNYNYYKIGIIATYNIFDEKTTMTIKNNKLLYKGKILENVSNYIKIKNDIKNTKNKLELDRLKQLRIKLMVKTAQKYLDERVKAMQDILSDNEKLTELYIKKETLKQSLLNLIDNKKRKLLKEML